MVHPEDMKHKVRRAVSTPVLAYDLGGTKIAAGVITPQGRVLESSRVPLDLARSKAHGLEQIAELGLGYLKKYPRIRRVGFASAGPLDARSGKLLDPTNLRSPEGPWGVVDLAAWLKRRLKRPVHLENDAAAAILAEHWKGAAKGHRNAMVLTLGTGLGVGVLVDGQLVRAGRGMHPEGGHIPIHEGDTSAPCGCGLFGCAEAYLAGRTFTHRFRARHGTPPEVKAPEIADLARRGDKRALEAFSEYSQALAAALSAFVVLYCPEVIVLTGSFAEASDLFLEPARKLLEQRLSRRRAGVDLMPKLARSPLDNHAGLIGGAWVALHSER